MKNKQANNNVTILTLGCSKNLVDSEELNGILTKNNINVTEDLKKSNTVIINTCGFIKPAKEESLQLIMEAREMKNQGLINKIIVTGCLSERYKDALEEQIPEVDRFFGLNDYNSIVKFLKNDELKYVLPGERITFTPKHYAYLKISEGCNHSCSFCAIPHIRGKHISKSIDSILAEANYLVSKGVKEINLIAQDSTYYGVDLYGSRKITELLDKISDIKGLEWIRLHYAYPTGYPEELLDLINFKENICKYVDIPLQHISDKLLKSMRRGISSGRIRKLIEAIRNKIHNVAFRTTFIVGYPDETEQDFNQLYNFIEEQKFERVGIFTYSHEEDTHAFKLDDNIPENVKIQRRNLLMELQQKISFNHNKSRIGKTLKVIIDEKNKNSYIGRTEHDSPDVDNNVIVYSEKNLDVGSFYNVKIEKAKEYDLIGKV